MYHSALRFLTGLIILTGCLFFTLACTTAKADGHTSKVQEVAADQLEGLSKAYFASGCFWCVEAIFEEVKGVKEAVSGYAGGKANTANYELVSSGKTKHAEAVEVYYDENVIDYETLLKVFFGSHDPTTKDQQGPDYGPQYRSVVFYQSAKEKQLTEAFIEELKSSGRYKKREVVTEVVPFEAFYKAEAYHQNFERLHPDHRYIQAISVPRLNSFKKKFPELLKNH